MTDRRGVSAPPRVAATLILASVGAFVTALDVVVVSTALPSLRAHLNASLSDLEWTINAYNLAFASLMLTGAALLVTAGVSYPSLVPPFFVAGVGISLVFPTLANAAVGSVPLADSGVAAGSNNTLREAGGLFGVAVLAAVFTANGGYGSRALFMHGMRYALIVAGAVALAAVLPSLLGPSRAPAPGTSHAGGPATAREPAAERQDRFAD